MKGNFQIIIIAVFIAAAVFGVLVFSGIMPLGKDKVKAGSQGTVTVWGTVKTNLLLDLLEDFNNANQTFTVKYVQKSADTFDQDLLEALASGTGPDLFFLPDNLAFHYKNKIYPIPYQSFPIDAYKNKFASAGEVFLTSKGIIAFPISIDPMVMYYNRTILDSNSIIYPPVFWDEFSSLVPILTKKDDSNQISKTAVALGQFSNITHAKDIISTLFMQAGNPIVVEKNGTFVSVLNEYSQKSNLTPMLKFYTNFSDPLKEVYSWNKSLPNSRDLFSAENLVFYFGFASELQSLINRNPNQNFLAAPMPQIKNASFKVTSARVTGIAVSAFSKNLTTAFEAASLMATGEFASKYATALGVVPIRRDLLTVKPADVYSPTFYDSALYAKSWLDPAPESTDDIFRKMIEGVLSNNFTVEDAIKDTEAKLSLLLIK